MDSTAFTTCTKHAERLTTATPRPTSLSSRASIDKFRHTLDGWNGLLLNDYLNADGAAAKAIIDAENASLQAYEAELSEWEAEKASVRSYEDGIDELDGPVWDDALDAKAVGAQMSRRAGDMQKRKQKQLQRDGDGGEHVRRWRPEHVPDVRPCSHEESFNILTPSDKPGNVTHAKHDRTQATAPHPLRDGEDEGLEDVAGNSAKSSQITDTKGPHLVNRGAWL